VTKVIISPSDVKGSVKVPPSKSYTHRFATLALLAQGTSKIENPLVSRDTEATFAACRTFGADVSQRDSVLRIESEGKVKLPDDVLDAKNSGTTIRFFTSIAGLVERGYTVLTGDESIRRRPMQPLIDALRRLGVQAFCTRNNGCPPVVVEGRGLNGGMTELEMEVSSQYLSGLLMASCLASHETDLKLLGRIVSRPYLEATMKALELFGGRVENKDWKEFTVQGRQELHSSEVTVPSDFGSAAFMLALGGLGGEVEVKGLDKSLPQADAAIVAFLKELGFSVRFDPSGCSCSGNGGVPRRILSLSDCPDLLPVLAVLGLRSEEGIRLEGVRHARFKESDRIALLASELEKTGAFVEEFEDGLEIRKPKTARPAELNSHDDHRLLMAFSLVPFATGQTCTISGTECVDVSYPNFFADMRMLGVELELTDS
jgi:3-phosphoshikimate 1-carboxyvinyltransferase